MSEVRKTPVVGILMGSDSDIPVVEEAFRVLDQFGVPFEAKVLSAHRSPVETGEYARTAAERGIRVILCAAGWAAHLAGVVAAETVLPVVGIPIPSSPLQGLDSLLATVQMPPGVPVATMAMGKGGAGNAALFAVQILSLSDRDLAARFAAYKSGMAADVVGKKNRKLEEYLAGRKTA